MLKFSQSDSLDSFILGLLSGDHEYADNLVDICDNYIAYDYNPLDAAEIGLGLGEQAQGKQVYKVRINNDDDVTYFFIGSEKSIREKISKDYLDYKEHHKKEANAAALTKEHMEKVFKKGGFEEVETGGRCTAWWKELAGGNYILITDEGGICIPNPEDDGSIGMGLMDSEGQSLKNKENIKFSDLESLIENNVPVEKWF